MALSLASLYTGRLVPGSGYGRSSRLAFRQFTLSAPTFSRALLIEPRITYQLYSSCWGRWGSIA